MAQSYCLSWFANVSSGFAPRLHPSRRKQFAGELVARWQPVLSVKHTDYPSSLKPALKAIPDDPTLICTVLLYKVAMESPTLQAVEYLVSLGADVNGRRGSCFFLWQLACSSPNVPFCSTQTTPVQLATLVGDSKGVTALVACGATPTALCLEREVSGETFPIHNNKSSTTAPRRLPGKDDASSEVSDIPRSPLRLLSEEEPTRKLLEQGWCWETTAEDLCLAARHGLLSVVQLLYHYGASTQHHGTRFQTPLSEALAGRKYITANAILRFIPTFEFWHPSALIEVLKNSLWNNQRTQARKFDIFLAVLHKMPKHQLQEFSWNQLYGIVKTVEQELMHGPIDWKLMSYASEEAVSDNRLWAAFLTLLEALQKHEQYALHMKSIDGAQWFLSIAIKMNCAEAVAMLFKAGYKAPTSVFVLAPGFRSQPPLEYAAHWLGRHVRKMRPSDSFQRCADLLRIMRILVDNGAGNGDPQREFYNTAWQPGSQLKRFKRYIDWATRQKQWSTSTHASFPLPFKDRTKAFLLCNSRAAAACGPGTCRTGHQALPLDICHAIVKTLADEVMDWA